MTSKRLLILCDVTSPGGVSVYLAQLWRAAIQHEWSAHLVLDENAGAEPVEAYLRTQGVIVTRALLRPGQQNEAQVASSVDQALADSRPDIVHAVLGSPRSLLVARERTIAAKLPLVFTEQYVSASLDISSALLPRLRALYEQASAVIHVCEENRVCATRDFDLTAKRSYVIANSVNNASSRAPHRSKPSRLLTVARLSRQKGLDVLLDAMPLVRSDASLAIAGDGELRADLQQRSARLGLTSRIQFLGWTDDVTAELMASDLFVLPSRAEGQPFALLEALAIGLPCIATHVSGIPEALGQGRYGELVPPEDPNALANAINTFLATPDALRDKAQLARENVALNFGATKSFDVLARVWRSAAATSM